MAPPKLIQEKDRTVHTSHSGIEIERTFYAEPYSSHPDVLKALQGSVEKNGETWERTDPAHDPWIENCYCTEAVLGFEDKEVMAGSPSLDAAAGNDLADKLTKQKETPKEGAAGYQVIAKYRPLLTAWTGDDSDGHSKWDWLEPKFTPGVREIPWPNGLFAETTFLGDVVPDNIPDEVGSPVGVPVHDVAIRRILVGAVPWETIAASANALNKDVFPEAGTSAADNLPAFPERTLKFTGVDILNMVDTEGNRWYELIVNFKWINLWAEKLFNLGAGGESEEGWVTWNHALYQPWWLGQGDTGWYEAALGEQRRIAGFNAPFDIPGFGLIGGRLHSEVNFMPLFKLESK